ncbi:HAMP domain-containing sensor histidine kinase [Thiomicrorhabdus sp. Milos-T2]|uniref:sensor histidine kinase n=1 Tax=Thiomicrorhabdus sp. Milos-T2 TaxID=90814 RepID=UPI0004945954|nr:ATP-binding protein [Thiomicrorhabdus sp. Milos-T2]
MDFITLKESLDLTEFVSEDIKLVLLHWGWLILVILGILMIGFVYYLRYKSKRLGYALSQLYSLNQEVEQDALSFFNQAWSILECAGCLQLQANVEWFGEVRQVLRGGQNAKKGRKVSFDVSRDDMSFQGDLFLSRRAAEPESLSNLVIKTFLNILEQDLVLKEAEILTSQKRLERYQMFVQHEIKNIAQFIQLFSEQVKQATQPQSKIMLIDRLSESLPIMAKRARKTIQHMQQPLSEKNERSYINLRILMQEVVAMYGLNAEIHGASNVKLSRTLLIEVFKNILGNFSDHPSSKEPVKILIGNPNVDGKVQIKIIGQLYGLENEMVSERLFEPFWTTSESGMGLGLFLARELLKQINGQINFEQSNKEFSFLVQLPGQNA